MPHMQQMLSHLISIMNSGLTHTLLNERPKYVDSLLAEDIYSCFRICSPLPSNRQYLSCDACLEVKRQDNQNCSVLCCVRQLCTMISTLRWAVLTVLWIGFCHTGFVSLCIDLFVFVCMYFMTAYVVLAYCKHGGVGLMGLKPSPWDPSSFSAWHCWLGHLTCKNPSPIWRIMCLVERYKPCSAINHPDM